MGSATLTAGTASGGESGEPTLDIAGEYRHTFELSEGDLIKGWYSLILNADGTGSFIYKTMTSGYSVSTVYTTNLTWEEVEGKIAITVEDWTYLQNGTYEFGTYQEEPGLPEYDALLNVIVLEGTSPAAYPFLLNEKY